MLSVLAELFREEGALPAVCVCGWVGGCEGWHRHKHHRNVCIGFAWMTRWVHTPLLEL